jgi:hypothetical protein
MTASTSQEIYSILSGHPLHFLLTIGTIMHGVLWLIWILS